MHSLLFTLAVAATATPAPEVAPADPTAVAADTTTPTEPAVATADAQATPEVTDTATPAPATDEASAPAATDSATPPPAEAINTTPKDTPPPAEPTPQAAPAEGKADLPVNLMSTPKTLEQSIKWCQHYIDTAKSSKHSLSGKKQLIFDNKIKHAETDLDLLQKTSELTDPKEKRSWKLDYRKCSREASKARILAEQSVIYDYKRSHGAAPAA